MGRSDKRNRREDGVLRVGRLIHNLSRQYNHSATATLTAIQKWLTLFTFMFGYASRENDIKHVLLNNSQS